MPTKIWLEYLQYEEFDVEITENLYNAKCTPKTFVEKYFESWDPKIHSPRNSFEGFHMAALIEKCGTNNHYPLAMFRNGLSKNTRSSYKGTIKNGTPLSSSDSEMASKIQKTFVKNCRVTFDKTIKINCLSLKRDDDELFKKKSKMPNFVLRPFLTMLNLEVDRLYLQKLDYEIDRTDYPVCYNFFETGYYGHPNFPCTNIQLEQVSDLILSHFQEEYHSFIKDTHRHKKIQLVYLYYVYKPKKNASRTDVAEYDKKALNMCQHIEMNPLILIVV